MSLPNLDQLAKQTKLVRRTSPKFTPAAFLQTLLSSVSTGLASFNQLASELKDRVSSPMTRQSFHERIGPRSTAFLTAVLGDLMEQRYQPVTNAIQSSEIKRVIIEDATSQVMQKSNAKAFPAHGNHHGQTAGVKIDFAFDLLTRTIISHTLNQATEQDKTIGKELIPNVLPGDLVVRDMGYFSINEFSAIEDCGAFWLTRLPLTTDVLLTDGCRLEEYLKRSKHDTIDVEVNIGKQLKMCRLIAVRAASEVVTARHEERHAKARKNGIQPSQKGLVRDGWHLMLTNLEKEHASVQQLATIYRARWAVEIQFRAWKQSLNLTKALNRTSGEHHLQALVLAAMIAHQLGMKMATCLGDLCERCRLSYEKLYALLAIQLIKARSLAEIAAFQPDIRHLQRDKRQRKSPVESAIQGLT